MNPRLDQVDNLIRYYGNATKTASALGVNISAVSNWGKRGVPTHQAIRIEALTKGKFKALDFYNIAA